MQELPAGKVEGNHVNGFQECWYAGNNEWRHGIRTTEKAIEHAGGHASFYGTPVSMDFFWNPEVVPYKSKLFLYKGANVIHSILLPKEIVKDVPLSTIYIIAPDKETIKKVAKDLNLEERAKL